MELNKIYLGDANKLIKDIPDKSIDLIVTDPPYNAVVGGGGGVASYKGKQKSFVSEIKEHNLYSGFDLSFSLLAQVR